MLRGEIYLAAFPYGDAATMKLRPVLILAGPVESAAEVLVAYISSVIPIDLLSTDLVINPTAREHQNTGLKATLGIAMVVER